jgi:thiamine pyrophosphokinase
LQRILIFANGELPDIHKAQALAEHDDYIICADGGTRHALDLGLRPDLIVGDLDSAEEGQLQVLRESGVAFETFSHDKNETDLELAIQRAIERKPGKIVIVGALGGRLDQTLANITLLSDPRLATIDIRLDDGMEEVLLCRVRVEVYGQSGDIVSLIPWQGPALGVRTEHLKWPLHSETLYPNKTRGVSNEMLGKSASILIDDGLLLVVHRRESTERKP